MNLKVILLSFFTLYTFINAQENDITIGIAPHSSTRVILESHQDLRLFLEKYFDRPVRIVTAKNFSEFSKRSNTGTFYDLVLTSPNLAVLAQKMGDYKPIMTYKKGLSTIILSKDKNILKKEKYPLHVIGLDPVSFPTLDAQKWLDEQGFNEDEKIKYTYTSATDSSIAILLNNHADMIIMSLPNYLKLLNNKMKDKVHVIYQSETKPSRVYLAKDRNGITLNEWKKALDIFTKSKEGQNHLKKTRLEGFKKIESKDLDVLKPIVEKTMKRLYK
ncbi:phosphate/phosphite/phosphonate ABC transporter substrate-binding protein [Campylobacterota bacterium DY0563]